MTNKFLLIMAKEKKTECLTRKKTECVLSALNKKQKKSSTIKFNDMIINIS